MTTEVYYEDLKDLLLGEKLGIGIYRKVAVYLLDPTLVIKVSETDRGNCSFTTS